MRPSREPLPVLSPRQPASRPAWGPRVQGSSGVKTLFQISLCRAMYPESPLTRGLPLGGLRCVAPGDPSAHACSRGRLCAEGGGHPHLCPRVWFKVTAHEGLSPSECPSARPRPWAKVAASRHWTQEWGPLPPAGAGTRLPLPLPRVLSQNPRSVCPGTAPGLQGRPSLSEPAAPCALVPALAPRPHAVCSPPGGDPAHAQLTRNLETNSRSRGVHNTDRDQRPRDVARGLHEAPKGTPEPSPRHRGHSWEKGPSWNKVRILR